MIFVQKAAHTAALWPLLSSRLVQQLETARACEIDYQRRHAGEGGKPKFAWVETGLFSGPDERALPTDVTIERVEERHGVFRVHVRFTYRETSATYGRPPDPTATLRWRSIVLVKREDGRFAVDDVLLFSDNSRNAVSRLSQMFAGCDGARWIGTERK